MRVSTVIGILLLILGIVRLIVTKSLLSSGAWATGMALLAGMLLVVAGLQRRRIA
jgi:hypothetical protein